MHRREALALLAAGAVPLAGCSSGDGGDGGNESSGGTDGSDGADTGGTNTTTTGNATDDVDGVDDSSSDPGGNESDSDGQTDEQSDGQDDDGSDEPSEEELAQEDIDAAQTALLETTISLEDQGAGSLSSGGGDPPVTANVSGLSDGPIRDQLSSVQSTIDDAREHETTGDQDDVLEALEATKDWLHAVLDAYQPLHELFLEANYAVQDFTAEDASADLQAVRRAADEAQSPVDSATNPYAVPEANGIDAIDTDAVEAQVDRLAADLGSGRSIADALEAAVGAESEFGTAMSHYENQEWTDAKETFDAAEQAFAAASSALSAGSPTYNAEAEYLTCDLPAMETASNRYHQAALNREFEDSEEYADHYQQEGEAALEDADGCSFD